MFRKIDTFDQSFLIVNAYKRILIAELAHNYFDRAQTIEQQRACEYVEPQELLSHKSVRSFLYIA